MARAGFYTIESREIAFGRDGNWYSDGEKIANRRIADLFSRSIEASGDGGHVLRVGDEEAPVQVEDTPFVVRQIREIPGGALEGELNDGTRETIDGSLRLRGDVLYCRVKNGRFEARLLRTAQASIAQWIVSGDGARWQVDTPAGRQRIDVDG